MRVLRSLLNSRSVRGLGVAAGILGGLGLAVAQEREPVALELVPALDSSSSVSAEEFDLQRQGLAVAVQ